VVALPAQRAPAFSGAPVGMGPAAVRDDMMPGERQAGVRWGGEAEKGKWQQGGVKDPEVVASQARPPAVCEGGEGYSGNAVRGAGSVEW